MLLKSILSKWQGACMMELRRLFLEVLLTLDTDDGTMVKTLGGEEEEGIDLDEHTLPATWAKEVGGRMARQKDIFTKERESLMNLVIETNRVAEEAVADKEKPVSRSSKKDTRKCELRYEEAKRMLIERCT